jgi:hypothetical protein
MAFPPDQVDSSVPINIMKIIQNLIKWFREGAYDFSVDRLFLKKLNTKNPSTLIISGGQIAVSSLYHLVDGAGGSTDLNTINAQNCFPGDILILQLADSARNVVLKHGTGNLKLTGGDVTLADDFDAVLLLYTAKKVWVKI